MAGGGPCARAALDTLHHAGLGNASANLRRSSELTTSTGGHTAAYAHRHRTHYDGRRWRTVGNAFADTYCCLPISIFNFRICLTYHFVSYDHVRLEPIAVLRRRKFFPRYRWFLLFDFPGTVHAKNRRTDLRSVWPRRTLSTFGRPPPPVDRRFFQKKKNKLQIAVDLPGKLPYPVFDWKKNTILQRDPFVPVTGCILCPQYRNYVSVMVLCR